MATGSTPSTGASANESAPMSNEEQYYQKLYDECSEELVREVYDKPDKRAKNVVDWDQFHMLVAVLSSKRSKDPNRQVYIHNTNSN
jgi:deoxycytidylate deaminase